MKTESLFLWDFERLQKNRLPGHSGSHFTKHLMKPASRFRFTGTPPASGLSWITDFTFTLINIHCNSLIVNRLLNYFCNKILTFAVRFCGAFCNSVALALAQFREQILHLIGVLDAGGVFDTA